MRISQGFIWMYNISDNVKKKKINNYIVIFTNIKLYDVIIFSEFQN